MSFSSSSLSSLFPPLPPSFLSSLKSFGLNFHKTSNGTISPVLASYLGRICLLANSDSADFRSFLNGGEFNRDVEMNLIRQLLSYFPSDSAEIIKLQVKFELKFTQLMEKQKENEITNLDHRNTEFSLLLSESSKLDSNGTITSSSIYKFYRLFFKYLLNYSQPTPVNTNSRAVHREIAAALESVFPQSSLNGFNLLNESSKRDELLKISDIVFGIRLFNQAIARGGEDIEELRVECMKMNQEFYNQLQTELQTISSLSISINDLMSFEYRHSGSIGVSIRELQSQLIQLRQLSIFLSQLQHDSITHSSSLSQWNSDYFESCQQLKTSISLRSALPKSDVYPRFQLLSRLFHQFYQWKQGQIIRESLFAILKSYSNSFLPRLKLRSEDLLLIRQENEKIQLEQTIVNNESADNINNNSLSFDSFVETVVESNNNNNTNEESKSPNNNNNNNNSAASLTQLLRPIRYTLQTSPNFLNYPLEYQGYCPYSLLIHDGFLTPGNPNYGLIKFQSRYYAFASIEGMKQFCVDPERFISGILRMIPRFPAFLHLLGLQSKIPYTDIADFITPIDLGLPISKAAFTKDGDVSSGAEGEELKSGVGSGGLKKKSEVEIQTSDEVVDSLSNDPEWADYHWNEWELRRRAIQLADLANKATHSTQTHQSHFRRDNGTQYSLQRINKDGTMPGKGSQTRVEKSTNSERSITYLAGLRGKSQYSKEIASGKRVASKTERATTEGSELDGLMKVIQFKTEPQVEDSTNPDLRKMKI